MELYQYRPLKNLEHLKWLQNSLEDKIWCTRIDELNDPFEGSFIYIPSGVKEILQNANIFKEYYELSKRNEPKLTEDELRERLQQSKRFYILTRSSDQIPQGNDFYIFFKDTKEVLYISSDGKRELTSIVNVVNFEKALKEIMRADIVKELTVDQVDYLIKSGGTTTKNWFKTHGVCCFTKVKNNIPMWAHYADNHAGYCLVFELDFNCLYEFCKSKMSRQEYDKFVKNIIDSSSDAEQNILLFEHSQDKGHQFGFFKIQYKEERPYVFQKEITELQQQDADEYGVTKYLVQHSVGVKYAQWSYENEYRLFTNDNSKKAGLVQIGPPNSYCPFLRVKGVILGDKLGQNLEKDLTNYLYSTELNGCRLGGDIPEKLRNEIIRLARSHGKEIFIAQPSEFEYAMEIKPYSYPYEAGSTVTSKALPA